MNFLADFSACDVFIRRKISGYFRGTQSRETSGSTGTRTKWEESAWACAARKCAMRLEEETSTWLALEIAKAS